MPLHCGIFYVAGIVPRAAGSPPALIQANSREGPDLCRPRRQPGAALTLPTFPLYGLLSVCCTAATAAKSASCGRRRFCPFSLPQPAALRIPLRPHRNRFAQPDTRTYALSACFPGIRRAPPAAITASVINPASPTGINPFRSAFVLLL